MVEHPSQTEAALFMSFDDGLKRAFWLGLNFDDAIAVMNSKIAVLQRCRDRGMDPKKY
ncbi:MAG: hypothetical protein ACK5LJ_08800 [Paracoccus sp. (in: a-proteobacteria)]